MGGFEGLSKGWVVILAGQDGSGKSYLAVNLAASAVLDGKIVSVSEVRMSPDLKIATCYVSPLGDEDAGKVGKALARNAKFIRGRASSRLNQMKYMPSFRFLVDESFDNFARIDSLLKSDRVSRDVGEKS